jgi:hypothetical protein
MQVPPWVREESLDRLAGDSPDWTDRGTADGNSVQPDSDFGELFLNHQPGLQFKIYMTLCIRKHHGCFQDFFQGQRGARKFAYKIMIMP